MKAGRIRLKIHYSVHSSEMCAAPFDRSLKIQVAAKMRTEQHLAQVDAACADDPVIYQIFSADIKRYTAGDTACVAFHIHIRRKVLRLPVKPESGKMRRAES